MFPVMFFTLCLSLPRSTTSGWMSYWPAGHHGSQHGYALTRQTTNQPFSLSVAYVTLALPWPLNPTHQPNQTNHYYISYTKKEELFHCCTIMYI